MRSLHVLSFAAVLAIALPFTAGAIVTDLVQNDAGTGRDAGDSWHTPTIIAPGSYSGTVYPVDDPQDWYGFAVTGKRFRVTLDATPDLCDDALGETLPLAPVLALELAVYDSEGNFVLATPPFSGCEEGAGPRDLAIQPHAGGVWRAVVRYAGPFGTPLPGPTTGALPQVPLAGTASVGPRLEGPTEGPMQTSGTGVVTRYLLQLADPCEPVC